MVNRTLATDLILWIVFVAAAVLGVILDRLAPTIMATWGWLLILIALGAGVAALAWPLIGEKSAASEAEPSPGVIEVQEVTDVQEAEAVAASAPDGIETEPVVVAEVYPAPEEPSPGMASEPESSADATLETGLEMERERGMSDFYRRVYRVVAAIPAGQVATYGQIAALLGYTHGARAVGWALHALPASTDVPWHRVVNATGRVSSSCAEHPGSEQCWRLRREGIHVDEDGRLDLAAHRWAGLHWSEVEELLQAG